jgi:RimJ/RimL family protein N-acetyltransferase
MNIEPIILEGEFVRLEPLSMKHFDDLAQVAFDEDLWKWTLGRVSNEEDLKKYIEEAASGTASGIYLALATIDKRSGKAVGATRFGSIAREYRRVEIGWTWIGRDFQRTVVNTEAKYLMLRHAFETWKALRVYLQTDALNERSQKAIARLGAKREGILRKDKITDQGRVRDSVIFSILDDEWAEVKNNLEAKMNGR